MKNKEEFVKAVTKTVVTVEFRKVGTDELRIMPCTLSEFHSDGKVELKESVTPDVDVFSVWCMEPGSGWRSFRCDRVERWYVGYPVDKVIDEDDQ